MCSRKSPAFLTSELWQCDHVKTKSDYLLVRKPHQSGFVLLRAAFLWFSYCQMAQAPILQPEKAKAKIVGRTILLQLVGPCSKAFSSSNLGPLLNSSFGISFVIFLLKHLAPLFPPNTVKPPTSFDWSSGVRTQPSARRDMTDILILHSVLWKFTLWKKSLHTKCHEKEN